MSNSRKRLWLVILVPPLCLHSARIVLAESTEPLVTVVASGAGKNADSALRDAFSQAVQQVVGVMVDAETLVKDDRVVRDQVLTYSNAYIERYDKLSESTDGGLTRVTIKAAVKRGQLIEKLQGLNVTLRHVEGPALFGKAVTQFKEEQDAAAMVAKVLEEFPAKLLTAQAVGETEILEKQSDAAKVRVWVQVKIDPTAYKSFAERLSKILEKAATKQHTYSAEATPTLMGKEPDKCRVWRCTTETMVRPKDPGRKLNLATRINSRADNISWTSYWLDASLRSEVEKLAQKKIVVRASFLDANQQPVWSAELPIPFNVEGGTFEELLTPYCYSLALPGEIKRFLSPLLKSYAHGYGSDNGDIFIAPFVFDEGRSVFIQGVGERLALEWVDDLRFPLIPTFTLADLKRVVAVKCEILSE